MAKASPLLTPREVASLRGCAYLTVLRAIGRGELPARKKEMFRNSFVFLVRRIDALRFVPMRRGRPAQKESSK